MNDLKNMTEHELLEELVKSQHADTRFTKLTAIANSVLALALVIALAVAVPRLLNVLSTAEEALAELEELSKEGRSSLTQIDTLVEDASSSLTNVEKLAEDADRLIEDNTGALEKAMENFNGVDFESLNSSIENLSAVSERLNSFTSFFGGSQK